MPFLVDYSPSDRNLSLSRSISLHRDLNIPNPGMRDRSEFLIRLDSMLDYDTVASMVLDRFGNFSCRFCFSPLISDGSNGSGTKEFLCRKCGSKMSLYNTFELSTFRYRKQMAAFLAYVHCTSSEGSASLFGLGKDLFNEMRMSLPEISYSRRGAPDTVEYDGTRYAIVTIDVMYKGHRGLMLGVSGGLKFGNIGNEDSGQGLDEFFSSVRVNIREERIIFIMDMKMSVAKKILDRWRENAIIILQSHRIWGDVFVYFHREEWFTLRLRTDSFSSVSVKSNESSLLPPGVIELYSGPKGVTHRNPMRKLSTDEIMKIASNSIDQVRGVDWNQKGRVDFVMAARIRDIAASLKELKRRKVDASCLTGEIEAALSNIEEGYKRRINRSVKKKIVNAWKYFPMHDRINKLSITLLGEPLKERKAKSISERNVIIRSPSKLVYRGPQDRGPPEAQWMVDLLARMFSGREITTNTCEGTFGNMGTLIRSGRSIVPERALAKNMLASGGIEDTARWFNNSYPMNDISRKAKRGNRLRVIMGRSYSITYLDHDTVKTERVIDVIERKRKYITAYCHLRNAVRTFKRSRIKEIIPA